MSNLSKWCIDNPWLTFFIVITLIEAVQAVLTKLIGVYKKKKELELYKLQQNDKKYI